MVKPFSLETLLDNLTRENPNEVKEEKKLLNRAPKQKNKVETALIIGRFQPFHRGHIYLIRYSLQLAHNIVLGIGSANITNEDNPFTKEERLVWIKKILKREELSKYVKKIVFIDDDLNDDVWLKVKTMPNVGKINIVIGNNDWVNSIFKKAGYKVIPIPLLQRETYQGALIRKTLRKHGMLRLVNKT